MFFIPLPVALPFEQPPQSRMETFNIALIGAAGVGKSSFIQRVLGYSKPPVGHITNTRVTIENVPYLTILIELDLEYFDINPDREIQWPKQVAGQIMPRVDGALILYDVMNRESITELPQTLSALSNSAMPTVLVATKCDNPENTRQINTEGVSTEDTSVVASFKMSSNVPESARNCLNSILKAAITNRRGPDGTNRRRAASVAHLDTPPDNSNGRPMSQNSKHSRASSDLSLVRGFTAPSGADFHRVGSSKPPRIDFPSPLSSTLYLPESADEDSSHAISNMLRTPGGVRLDRGPEGFDIEESDAESMRHSEDIPILQRGDEIFLDRPAKAMGMPFDELVDRIIALKMTRADNNFADIFLCLYRKFSSPSELFRAILSRLDQVKDDKNSHYLTKTATELRIIEVVAKWVLSYPGDFARPTTKGLLEDFIGNLTSQPIFNAAAVQMRRQIESNVVEDDDTMWERSDDWEEGSETDVSTKDGSDLTSSVGNLQIDGTKESGHTEQRRASASSDLSHTGRQGQPIHFQFHTCEDYERAAATLVPSETLPLTKSRYNIFMQMSDEDIADELTRIDWIMFSSIRIRDLVRDVSLSHAQKEKCRSLRNVNRMIQHFNHVARWVANMVLIRDKAKHRALMLEKFMNISLKLRQLNNYNGLAAVLAGINSTAVHRLAQTRLLVPQDVQRRFARLVLLMGTQKSHFAYRLAWENSPLPRIPFMPLHRRDLVSAEEGSRTFVGPQGDRVNWKKFEVLGEVLLPIMRSQGTPYPNLTKHLEVLQMILDCNLCADDEDIYQRSLAVESASGVSNEPMKKRFPWFAKQ
ncbi:ras GEF [Zalerion maritima]|uniref:Ras GEF n=1 Tax=Zalerion maritima TaxID=339359 RepID=A0AAD5RR94_9PEZI|nr:ras GEF [Zalerion maritima]